MREVVSSGEASKEVSVDPPLNAGQSVSPILIQTEELVLETSDVFLLDAYSRLGYSSSDLGNRHYHDLSCYLSILSRDVDREQCRASQLLRFYLFSVDPDFECSVTSEGENVGPGEEGSSDVYGI